MTRWQICKQLQSLLQARTWADADGTALGSAGLVLGTNVVISAGVRINELLTSLRLPCAIITPGPTQRDAEANADPRIRQGTMRVKIIQAVRGDAYGQAALMGANIADEGLSAGHGLLEIEEQVEYTIQDLSQTNGIWVYVLGSSQPIPAELEDQGMVVFTDVDFDAKMTTSRFYAPCPVFEATGGSGSVSLSWSLAPDRFDRYRVVLRRASGASAPTSITDGTGVTLAGDEATSVTDVIGAGTYSYALFQTYDDRSATPDSDDNVSASITQTSVVVS